MISPLRRLAPVPAALLLLLLPVSPAGAADGRLAGWAAAFTAGDAARVLPAVAADLAGAAPAPLAADVWVRVERALGRDAAAEAVRLPAAARTRLGQAASIDLADGAEALAPVLAASPPAAAAATGNPALLRTLAEAAAILGRWDLSLDYRVAAVTADPDHWDGVALLLDDLAAHPAPGHLGRVAALAGTLVGHPAAAVLALAARAGGALTPGDRLELARQWLRGHPDDAAAWRDAGGQAMALERFGEADRSFARADALYPFAADGGDRAAALIRLGRMDQARAVVEAAAGRLAPAGDSARRLVLRTVARALVAAGELGRAHAALDGALGQWPLDSGLLLDRGRLELELGRPLHAIAPLQRAVAEGGAAVRQARVALVQAWAAAGKPVRAYESYRDLRRQGAVADPAWLAAAMRAAEAYGDHQTADTLGADFLDSTPEAAGILADRAVSLAALGATGRAAGLMRRSFLLAPPDDSGLTRFLQWSEPSTVAAGLAGLRHDLPWSAPVWHAAEGRLATGDTKGRAALEAEAVAAAPTLAWPYLDQAAAAADPGASRLALDRGLAAVPAALAGQRALLLARRAGTEDGDAALADLDAARGQGLAEGDFHRLRAGLLVKAGLWPAAAAEDWDWAGSDPDDGDAVAALFQPRVAELVGWPRVFAHLTDWVERNPFDPARRLEALRRQAGPGGSPVLAMAEAQALDRGAPGDARGAEARRLRAGVVAGLKRLGRLVDLDVSLGRLVVERPDGTRVEADFHPVSGRLLRYAEGPAWIRASWDAGGTRLLSLSDAGGDSITLDWDGGRLAGLEVAGGIPLRARLGPDGVPSRIESALPAAATAYDRAVAVTAAWARGDLAAVPELPFADPALSRLEKAEAAGGDRARLATAAYLVAHVGARRAFAAEARARLDAVLDQAMAAGDPRRHSPGLVAAALWRDLALAAWPDGLGRDSWQRWTAIRDWAGDPALDRPGPEPAASAREGAGGWLTDPADWRPLPAECVLAAGTAPPLAMLLRGDGDLVVGTGSGLRVLRQGEWQCYAFADRLGRFFGDEAGTAGTGAPAVSALAEGLDGVLWLAAGDRLVRMDGPYDAVVESWALPPGRLAGLVPLGAEVLAASPAGLRRYGRGGSLPLPAGLADLATVPLRALAVALPSGGAATVLAATPSALLAWRGDRLLPLVDGPVDAALWLADQGSLTVVAGGRVLSTPWSGSSRPPPPAAAAPAGELRGIGRPLGLATVTGDDGQPLVAVLGESGLAILRGDHADLRPLPGPLAALAARRSAVWVGGPAGLWGAEEGAVVK